jgi:hypothetical protein
VFSISLSVRAAAASFSCADFVTTAYAWVLVKAKGLFFESSDAGGQIVDFGDAVRATMNEAVRCQDSDEQVVQDGHYMWFRRNGTRLAVATPAMKHWLLSSRSVTAPGSVKQNAGGAATPSRVRTFVTKLKPAAD